MIILGIDPGTAETGYGIIEYEVAAGPTRLAEADGEAQVSRSIFASAKTQASLRSIPVSRSVSDLNGNSLDTKKPSTPATRRQLSSLPHKNIKLITYGCIKTSVNDEMPKRLVVLHGELKKVINTHKPACMAIEQLFFGQNSKTAMAVGQAKGVIMFCAGENGLPVYEYQGLSVKLGLSGNGRAKKPEIQSCVRKILGLRSLPRPDHAADALGVAIHHARKNILNQIS